MVDQDAFRRTMGYLARALTDRGNIGAVLYELADRTVAVVDCSGVGVAVREPGGQLRAVAATTGRVGRLEQLEIETGQGPSTAALAVGEAVSSADLTDEQRWPDYTPAALDDGVRAVAGFPLRVETATIGMLDLHWTTPHRLRDPEREVVTLLADMAAAVIVNLGRLDAAESVADQLQRALDSRVVIEQAKGVIARRHGIGLDEAFDRLREHARLRNLRLHDLAEQIVAGEQDL